MANKPFKMKGSPMQRNFGIGSPLKENGTKEKGTEEKKTVNWDEAPALHTHDRRRWYDKNKLKQDHTTNTEGYHSTETGEWTDVSGEGRKKGNKFPTKSSQIDMTKTKPGSEAALWHMNLKIQETPWTEIPLPNKTKK